MAGTASGTIGLVVVEPDRWCMPMIERACDIIGAFVRRIDIDETSRIPEGVDALVLCSADADYGPIRTIAAGFPGPVLLIADTVDEARLTAMDADRIRRIARPTRSIDLADELLSLLRGRTRRTDADTLT
ncbi:MAG TPA: hypothetical protein PKM65_19425 [Spirochaetota bacterium]|nr:hypothetical protein [Spirochaetota bacterium]HNT12999.1 hypothetical protein [Spirochaetota bacterium]